MPKTSEKAPFSDVTVQPKKTDQRHPLTSGKETGSRAGYSVSSAFPGMAGWSVLGEENPAGKTISDIVDEVVLRGVGGIPLAATTANQTQAPSSQAQASSSQAQAPSPSPSSQAQALNQVSGVPTSSLPLNYARISKPDTGAALTKERREAISRMWQKTKFWNKVEAQWDGLSDAQKNAHQIIGTTLHEPSVENVYHLQKHIGMQEGDVYNGRDGILGKHTLKKLQQFLNNLKYPQP